LVESVAFRQMGQCHSMGIAPRLTRHSYQLYPWVCAGTLLGGRSFSSDINAERLRGFSP
jgi:hypothetical protein